jgi:uncharacterized protein YkwD
MDDLRLAAALSAVCLGALVAAPLAAADCPGSTVPADAQSEAAIEQSVLCLINEQRGGAGLRAVSSNSLLRAAGLGHSSEMVSQGYFGHTSPSGLDFIDRILDTGYTRGARRWTVGENLAWGTGAASSPAALIESWMGSPPHRANLLRARFREVGVAAVRGTPVNRADGSGVTISSEYGYRAKKRGKKKYIRKR